MKNMYFKYILIYLFFTRDTYVYCKLKLQSTVQYCQNFNVGKVFLMFLKENSYDHASHIYSIKNKNSNTV